MNPANPSAEKKPKTEAAPIILIADDDDSLRRVLEFQLREGGYEVFAAADGIGALELFTERGFDCRRRREGVGGKAAGVIRGAVQCGPGG